MMIKSKVQFVVLFLRKKKKPKKQTKQLNGAGGEKKQRRNGASNPIPYGQETNILREKKKNNAETGLRTHYLMAKRRTFYGRKKNNAEMGLRTHYLAMK